LINPINQEREQSMLSTTPAPTAVLQECAIFAYQNNLIKFWDPFYQAAMKKLVGISTGDSPKASTPRVRVRQPTAAGAVRRRGRPAKTAATPRATGTGVTVNTEQVIAKVMERPGISYSQLATEEFPGAQPKILGRCLGGAAKNTKFRGPAITKTGTGKSATYYPAPGYVPAAMAA
jgi:hypothetical protein